MNKKRFFIISCTILIILVLTYCGNNIIVKTSYEIKSEKLTTLDGSIKIVQLSDLHNKCFGSSNENLIDIVNEAEPDMIVITGDYIDSYNTETQIAIDLSKKLVEIAEVFYVTGNHEMSINENELFSFLEELKSVGVNVMNNSFYEYNENIVLVGLDNDSLTLESNTLNAIMENIDSGKYTILLAHEPQELDWYASCGVDLVLSGHAHGGQIRVPFTNIGLIAPDQGLFPKYTSGKYNIDDTEMIVSRGLGNSIIPIRVFNQPEIVEIVLN